LAERTALHAVQKVHRDRRFGHGTVGRDPGQLGRGRGGLGGDAGEFPRDRQEPRA
jgi:hypothetical protein